MTREEKREFMEHIREHERKVGTFGVFQSQNELDWDVPYFGQGVVFDCRMLKTTDDFYKNFREAFGFGTDFGNNLDALYDTLSDLDWLNALGITFVFFNTDDLFSGDLALIHKWLQVFIDLISEQQKPENTDKKQIDCLFQESRIFPKIFDEMGIKYEIVDRKTDPTNKSS